MQTAVHVDQPMPQLILVERDGDGLRLAALNLYEESLQQQRIASVLENADAETRARALDELPDRELSPGYYKRAAYLLDLAYQVEMGLAPEAGTLTRADVVGLMAVKQARQEFEREHPACYACGERQDNRFLKQCFKCGQKFGKGAR